MEWKYKVGDTIKSGDRCIFVVTGRREEECLGGTQRFYIGHHILESLGNIGFTEKGNIVPDIVLEEMEKFANREKR